MVPAIFSRRTALVLLALIIAAAFIPPASAETYVFVRSIGMNGTASSQFVSPSGLAVDAGGFVYVTDSVLNRVQKFDPNGILLATWGVSAPEGTDPPAGQLAGAGGIHKDDDGNIYIIDARAGSVARVQKFSADGMSRGSWGIHGSGQGQFDKAYDCATDSAGNLYVTDTGNNRIEKFLPDGTFQTSFGSAGKGDGQFIQPLGIAIGTSDTVYVADSGNNRIVMFSTTGQYLGAWGSAGTMRGQFNTPAGLAVDSGGNVFVVDSMNYRVQKFSGNGTYLAAWGTRGEIPGRFIGPSHIAVDTHDGVYVLDSGQSAENGKSIRRFQKFVPETAAGAPTATPTVPDPTVTLTPLPPVTPKTESPTAPASKNEPDTIVSVSSEPQGATIWIGETIKGTTPTSLLLPKGTYTMILKKDGFKDDESSLAVTSGEKMAVTRTLQAPGFATILALAALAAVAVLVRGRR